MSRVEVRIGGAEEAETAPSAKDDSPRRFRILLIADFSGRPSGPIEPRVIDRDNFEDVLAGIKPAVELNGVTLEFRGMDDFHPDHIYQSATLFQNLEPCPETAPPPAAPRREVPTAGLLDQILAEQGGDEPVTTRDADDLAGFIRRVSAGHVERERPGERAREAHRQELAAEVLRGILHHPRFQAMEAAWRAVDWLVRELDTDSDLRLYVLDITLAELVRKMDAVQAKLKGKGPWALIAGNYVFGQTAVDAEVLRRLGEMAKKLGAPFVGEARLSGEEASERTWAELRGSEAARWIGLAMPRFLLRLPYGKDGLTVESLPFEEMPESEHRAYLWGNPAFACAKLVAESFLAGRTVRRIDGLPLYVYREDGEALAKPCAEIFMTEQDAENLLEAGFMPLVSVKNQPAAVLMRLQSIAEPAAPLAGLG